MKLWIDTDCDDDRNVQFSFYKREVALKYTIMCEFFINASQLNNKVSYLPCSPVNVSHKGGTVVPDTLKTSVWHAPA